MLVGLQMLLTDSSGETTASDVAGPDSAIIGEVEVFSSLMLDTTPVDSPPAQEFGLTAQAPIVSRTLPLSLPGSSLQLSAPASENAAGIAIQTLPTSETASIGTAALANKPQGEVSAGTISAQATAPSDDPGLPDSGRREASAREALQPLPTQSSGLSTATKNPDDRTPPTITTGAPARPHGQSLPLSETGVSGGPIRSETTSVAGKSTHRENVGVLGNPAQEKRAQLPPRPAKVGRPRSHTIDEIPGKKPEPTRISVPTSPMSAHSEVTGVEKTKHPRVSHDRQAVFGQLPKTDDPIATPDDRLLRPVQPRSKIDTPTAHPSMTARVGEHPIGVQITSTQTWQSERRAQTGNQAGRETLRPINATSDTQRTAQTQQALTNIHPPTGHHGSDEFLSDMSVESNVDDSTADAPEFSSTERADGRKSATTVQARGIEGAGRSVVNQIVHAAKLTADGIVEIRLSPEELGRVRLSMSAQDAGMVVQVTAERPETLDLLRRNIDMLEADLQRQGFSNMNFSFSQGRTPDREFSEFVPDSQGSGPHEADGPDVAAMSISSHPITLDGRLDIRL